MQIFPLNQIKKGIENIFLKSNIKGYLHEIQTLILQTQCTNKKMSKCSLDKYQLCYCTKSSTQNLIKMFDQ
jgi:hypothetical protein